MKNDKSIKILLETASRYVSSKHFGKASSYYLLAIQRNTDICITKRIEILFTFEKWCVTLINNNDWKSLEGFIETVLLFCHPIRNDFLKKICDIFIENDLIVKAKEILNSCCGIKILNIGIKDTLEHINNYLVDRWHFRMLNDKQRNVAYYTALEQIQKKGSKNIIDIGSGTGLLSVFAKKVGFSDIYSCESCQVFAKMQHNILKQNKMDDCIQLLNSSSLELSVPENIPQRLDALVTEIFDCSLIGEGALKTIRKAHEKLLVQYAVKVIPESATVYGICIECEEIQRQSRFVDDDLKICLYGTKDKMGNEKEFYTSEYMNQIKGGYQCLSESFEICNYNFANRKDIEDSIGKFVSVNTQCTYDGQVDAIMVYFLLNMDSEENIFINTHPDNMTCWEQAIYVLPKCPSYKKGEIIDIEVACNEDHYIFNVMKPNENYQIDEFANFNVNRQLIARLNDNLYTYTYHKTLFEQFSKLRNQSRNDQLNVCFLHFDLLLFPTIFSLFCTGDTILHFVEPSIEILSVLLAVDSSLKNRIKVIHRPIEESLRDMNLVFDLVVSEIVNPQGLLNENTFQDLSTIRSMFATENTVFVPNKVNVYASLLSCDQLVKENKITNNDVTIGVDVSQFMRDYEVCNITDIELSTIDYKLLSKPIQCFSYNYQTTSLTSDDFRCVDKIIGIESSEGGSVTGVLYWFELSLNDSHKLSTFPSKECHWRCSCTLLDESIEINPNESLLLRSSQFNDNLYFTIV